MTKLNVMVLSFPDFTDNSIVVSLINHLLGCDLFSPQV
jgi:hypothetical protein